MVLRDFFRRPSAVTTREALEDFLDGRAAFVTQKAIFEYSRAAAGYLWQPLFDEEEFKAALERSRWLAYPLGLAAVAEIAEALLRPACPDRAPDMLCGLQAMLDRVLGRHRPPASVTVSEWTAASAFCLERTGRLQARPVRAVKDMPDDIAEPMFLRLPLHEKIRGRDPVLLRNNLTASLIAVHDELEKCANAPQLAASLFDDTGATG